jgi:hypothetical protein
MPPETNLPDLSSPTVPDTYSMSPTLTASENGRFIAAGSATGKYSAPEGGAAAPMISTLVNVSAIKAIALT